MVLHVGIVCYTNPASYVIYDTDPPNLNTDAPNLNKTIHKLKAVNPSNIDGVDAFFDDISFKGKLGCVCICLGEDFDSDIRRKFVDAAKKLGFSKVEITDWFSIIYCELMARAEEKMYDIEKEGIVWIFCGRFCHIWQKGDKKAKFLEQVDIDKNEESLKTIKQRSKVNLNPILVICQDEITRKKIEKLYPNFLAVHYNKVSQCEGALIKARIIAGDPEVINYDASPILERDIRLNIGEKVIAFVEMGRELPYSLTESVVNNHAEKYLKVVSHKNKTYKKLPPYDNFIIKLYIDINGILEIEYEDATSKYVEKQKEHLEGVIAFFNTKILTYNFDTKKLAEFSTSIDLGFSPPTIGSSENSLTVVNDAFKYIGMTPNSINLPIISRPTPDGFEHFYFVPSALHKNNKDVYISFDEIIPTLLKQALTHSTAETTILIIPSYFNEEYEKVYTKILVKTGLINMKFIYEYFALAAGCEEEYKIDYGERYVIICCYHMHITVSMFKVGKTREVSYHKVMELYDPKNFEDCFAQVPEKSEIINNITKKCTSLIEEVNKLLVNDDDHLHSIFIAHDKDVFEALSITNEDIKNSFKFIENLETIAVKSAAKAYAEEVAAKYNYPPMGTESPRSAASSSRPTPAPHPRNN